MNSKETQKPLFINKEEHMMKENKKGFKVWVKEHKKQLIIAGVSAMAVTGIILGYKNKDFIIEKLPQFKGTNNQSKVTVISRSTPKKCSIINKKKGDIYEDNNK